MAIRIALADDHRMMRDVLCDILAREADFEVIGTAANGHAALQLMREHSPDVLLLDISMPDMNGIDVARTLLRQNPDVKVLALSAYTDKHYVDEMLKAGAKGYASKSAAAADLPSAIRAVYEGKNFLSPEVASAVVGHFASRPAGSPPPASKLAAREREVLQLLAQGKRTAFIAKRMNICAATVEVYRRNIMQKLDLHSVAELTKYAIREGLTSV